MSSYGIGMTSSIATDFSRRAFAHTVVARSADSLAANASCAPAETSGAPVPKFTVPWIAPPMTTSPSWLV